MRLGDNLQTLAASQFLRGAHNSIYGAIWQPFATSLGASIPFIGILSTIGGMGGIITTLVQPIGGRLADRVGRKPIVIAAGVGALVAYTIFAVASATQFLFLLLPAMVALGFSAIARPATSSLTAESARAERHASTFALMMVAAMAPGIVAPVLGGWLADRAGYVAVFPILLALEMIAMLVLWRYLRETRVAPVELARAAARRPWWTLVVPPRRLLGFYCALAGDAFAWGMGWGLLPGMLATTLHYSNEQLGIMASVMSLAWAVMQYPIGRYVDRRGTKPTMVFSEFLGIPLMLIWMTQARFEIFVASQVLFALTAATWVPVTSTYLTRSVTAAERAEAFGRVSLFRGLIAFPAPWIGGLLFEWGGMAAPLLANLVGSCVVIAILVLFVHEPQAREP